MCGLLVFVLLSFKLNSGNLLQAFIYKNVVIKSPRLGETPLSPSCDQNIDTSPLFYISTYICHFKRTRARLYVHIGPKVQLGLLALEPEPRTARWLHQLQKTSAAPKGRAEADRWSTPPQLNFISLYQRDRWVHMTGE